MFCYFHKKEVEVNRKQKQGIFSWVGEIASFYNYNTDFFFFFLEIHVNLMIMAGGEGKDTHR